jgi:hypothetical protein
VVDQTTRPRRLWHPDLGVRGYNLVALRATDDSFVYYIAHLPVDSIF